MIGRRDMLLGGIFLAGLGAEGALGLARRRPAARPAPIDALLPQRVADWQAAPEAAPLLPQRDSYVDQIYDDYVARSYVRPGAPPVIVLIAYGQAQGGGIEVHRPESCYPPYGYALSPSREVRLDLQGRDVAATALTATLEGRADQILYWVRVGETFPVSRWQAGVAVAGAALAGRVLDGILVRLSMVVDDAASGQRTLEEFASQLVRSSPAALAGLLVGAR